jgi:hydrogenase-4 component B
LVSKSLWVSGFAVVCIGILALVGALAIACFTKALGMSFLGRARSRGAQQATEVNRLMVAAQAILAFACIFLGVCASFAMRVIEPVCTAIFGTDFDLTGSYTMPMGTIAALMALLTLITYALFLAGKRGGVKQFITWECGFGDLSQRMQGTALSFAENISSTFAPLLLYKVRTNISGRDRRHFPEQVAIDVTSASLVETRFYNPAVRCVRWLGERMLLLQAGSVHLYLGYILLTLVVLMLVGILF